MYEKLVKRLRVLPHLLFVQLHGHEDVVYKAADAIEELSMKLHGDEAAIAGMKREIERMVVADKPRWIPISERLPKEEDEEVLVVAVNSFDKDDRWTAIDWLYCGTWQQHTIVTHWMPLPEPPKEDKTS